MASENIEKLKSELSKIVKELNAYKKTGLSPEDVVMLQYEIENNKIREKRLHQLILGLESELKDYRTKGLAPDAAKELQKDLDRTRLREQRLRRKLQEVPREIGDLQDDLDWAHRYEQGLHRYIGYLQEEIDRLQTELRKYVNKKPGRSSSITEEEKKIIKARKKSGKTVREIAEEFHLSKSTVQRILNEVKRRK